MAETVVLKSLLSNTVPLSPTTTHVLIDVLPPTPTTLLPVSLLSKLPYATARSAEAPPPSVCTAQVTPLSNDRSTTPPSPTATHALTHSTECRFTVVFDVRVVRSEEH